MALLVCLWRLPVGRDGRLPAASILAWASRSCSQTWRGINFDASGRQHIDIGRFLGIKQSVCCSTRVGKTRPEPFIGDRKNRAVGLRDCPSLGLLGTCDIRFVGTMRYGPRLRNDSAMTGREGRDAAIAVIRWSARVLGVIMASFQLFMFVGYSLEGRSPLSGSLAPFAAIGLALMGIYVVAMFLALKWERAGSLLGATVLGGFFVIVFLGLLPGNVSRGLNAQGVLNPFFLALWLPILLYLVCWGLKKRGAG